jgi:hypothetical protein
MIRFQFFPRSQGIHEAIQNVIDCFVISDSEINSSEFELASNEVLAVLRPHLEKHGYRVEFGKAADQKIHVPVLFGRNNQIDKFFNADAVSDDGTIVIEVEAGRAVVNNQFLKDIFQACMMFDVEYLIIAVRNSYRGGDDFERVFAFLETLYISNRLRLPLKGILLIGY